MREFANTLKGGADILNSNRRRLEGRIPKETHFSAAFKAQLRSTEQLQNSLSVGSKNRLKQYMRGLSVTRGDDSEEGRKFDKQLYHTIKPYLVNPSDFRRVKDYLHNLVCEDGHLYSRSLKIYSTTEDGMKRFAEKDHTSFRWNKNYQKSLEFYRRQVSSWNLKPLTFNDDDDIIGAIPKRTTHSGYTYIESGIKQKGLNMDGVYQRYKTAEEKALELGSFNRPIMTEFRTQVSGEFEDDGTFTNKAKHKCRTVCMVDLLQIIAELQFAKPAQSQMSHVNWYAGGKDEVDISKIIHDYHSRLAYFSSTDYSSYDQTISSWLIEDAFEVLSSAFVMTEHQKQVYDIVVHDFIHKQFITAHGLLESHKGIPSGSMFTQIIGSLINCIVMRTYYYSCGEEDVLMIAMGDDNASFCRNAISIENMASYIIKNFGIIVKTDDKTMYGGYHDEVKFLSRYWTASGPRRDKHAIIARLLYSERTRRYDDQVTPAHVILAFCLTYYNMGEIIDVGRFRHDYPISDVELYNVDSRYIPGAMAYIRDYELAERKKVFAA